MLPYYQPSNRDKTLCSHMGTWYTAGRHSRMQSEIQNRGQKMSLLEVNARRGNFTDWLVFCSACRSKPSGWSLSCLLPMKRFSFQIVILEMKDISQIQSRALDLLPGTVKVIRVFCYIFFPGKNVEIYLIHVDNIFKQIITVSFGMVVIYPYMRKDQEVNLAVSALAWRPSSCPLWELFLEVELGSTVYHPLVVLLVSITQLPFKCNLDSHMTFPLEEMVWSHSRASWNLWELYLSVWINLLMFWIGLIGIWLMSTSDSQSPSVSRNRKT